MSLEVFIPLYPFDQSENIRGDVMWHWIILLIVLIVLLFSMMHNIGKIMQRGEKPNNEKSKPKKVRKDVSPVLFGRKKEKEETGLRWKIILSDTEILEDYEYVFSDAIGIGRKKEQDDFDGFLMVNDPKISKLHCSIFVYENKLYLQDEGSSNATFLNGKKLKSSAVIQKGDVISIGNTTLKIVKVFKETR